MEAKGGKNHRQGAPSSSSRRGGAGQSQVGLKPSVRSSRPVATSEVVATDGGPTVESRSLLNSVAKRKSPLVFLTRGIKSGSSKKATSPSESDSSDRSVIDTKDSSILPRALSETIPVKSESGLTVPGNSNQLTGKTQRKSALSRVLSKCRPKIISKSMSSPVDSGRAITMDRSCELNPSSVTDDESFSSYATAMGAASSSGYSTPMMFESGLGTPDTSQSLTESLVEATLHNDEDDETEAETSEATMDNTPTVPFPLPSSLTEDASDDHVVPTFRETLANGLNSSRSETAEALQSSSRPPWHETQPVDGLKNETESETLVSKEEAQVVDSFNLKKPKWTIRTPWTAPLASSESSLSSKLTWDQTSLSSGQVANDELNEEVSTRRRTLPAGQYSSSSLTRAGVVGLQNQEISSSRRSRAMSATPGSLATDLNSATQRPSILFSSATPSGSSAAHERSPKLNERPASTGEIRFTTSQFSGRSLSQPDTFHLDVTNKSFGGQPHSLPSETNKMSRVNSDQPTSLGSDGNGYPKNEHLYKVLVIGELGTGKTSIIKRYVHQFFSQHYRATIGVDFALKVVHWDQNTVIRLQLWDIAGQERFGNMTRVYYKEAVGAFIVFDVTRSSTFDSVIKWKQDLDTKVHLPDGSPIPCVLLANKCDQPKEGIAANPAKLDEFCKEKGFAGWFETSAKDNINIDDAAKFLVRTILENDKWSNGPVEEDPDKVDLNGKTAAVKKNKIGCC